jgi:hypothetical protein
MWTQAILAALSLLASRDDSPSPPRCPPPPAHWLSPSEGAPDHRVALVVRIEGRSIVWAGRRVSERRLRTSLARSRRMDPRPFILLDASRAADCARIAEVRRLIDEAAGCTTGFCGAFGLGDGD